MNAAEIHLALNHLPVVIPLVGIAIVIAGLLRRSLEVQQVGLWILVVSALVAIPAFLTGDPAEDLLKNYPGVSRMLMQDHEKAAQLSLIFTESNGVVSLLLLLAIRFRKRVTGFLWAFLLILSVCSTLLLMRTAHMGGEIRHEEIRSNP